MSPTPCLECILLSIYIISLQQCCYFCFLILPSADRLSSWVGICNCVRPIQLTEFHFDTSNNTHAVPCWWLASFPMQNYSVQLLSFSVLLFFSSQLEANTKNSIPFVFSLPIFYYACFSPRYSFSLAENIPLRDCSLRMLNKISPMGDK